MPEVGDQRPAPGRRAAAGGEVPPIDQAGQAVEQPRGAVHRQQGGRGHDHQAAAGLQDPRNLGHRAGVEDIIAGEGRYDAGKGGGRERQGLAGGPGHPQRPAAPAARLGRRDPQHGRRAIDAIGRIAGPAQIRLQIACPESQLQDPRPRRAGQGWDRRLLPAAPVAAKEGAADPIIGPGELIVETSESHVEGRSADAGDRPSKMHRAFLLLIHRDRGYKHILTGS